MDHIPVMTAEVLGYLIHTDSKLIVDGTVGAGGHAGAILEAAPGVTLVGIDRDPKALKSASDRLARFGNRVRLVRGVFPDIESILPSGALADGILLDLGLSSMQLDDPARGFSHSAKGPLDMRMGPGGETLAEWLAGAAESEITDVLKRYGEVARARKIAREIGRTARRGGLDTTSRLREAVEQALGPATKPSDLSRVFQAFRIRINREIEFLERFFSVCIDCLNPGGRVVVISYHSLEDRAVKSFFKLESATCVCPPGLPVCACGHKPRLRVLTRRVVRPSGAEAAANNRSRSARLRAAAKI